MMEPVTAKLSRQAARRVLLAAQGLDRRPERPANKADLLQAIRNMGVLQIDTIHVVARSPYLVLWSRLGDYPLAWLDELLAERAIFEYWSHAMCFVPIEDYPLYRRRMLDYPQQHPGYAKWAGEHTEAIERVLARLGEQDEVRSVEFENKDHVAGGWWNWKDEKIALEYLLLTGQIMVAQRQNFQRVYTLRQRLLPNWDDAAIPSHDAIHRELTLRSVHALGIALQTWVADYYRQPKTGIARQLEALAAEGLLARVAVEGFDAPAYIHTDRLGLLDAAETAAAGPPTTLLSPFDPLVWDRQRTRDLFDFDYTIECYTPAAKRRYGYFTLPILHRGRIVGRLDPKAHRAAGLFEVKALHLEPGVGVDDRLIAELAAALRRLAAWHATPQIVVRWSDPPEIAAEIESAVQNSSSAIP